MAVLTTYHTMQMSLAPYSAHETACSFCVRNGNVSLQGAKRKWNFGLYNTSPGGAGIVFERS